MVVLGKRGNRLFLVAAHAIAEDINLLLPGLLGDGLNRCEDALVHVVLEGLLRALRCVPERLGRPARGGPRGVRGGAQRRHLRASGTRGSSSAENKAAADISAAIRR